MKEKALVANLTVGVSSVGNIEGLKCCLSALASGSMLPNTLNLRLESDIPGINDYYIEQLLCVFRFHGVNVNIQLRRARGINATREAQVDQCETTWLLLLDDDVLPDSRLVETYAFIMGDVTNERMPVAIQGIKPDLNNRRGYADFSMDPVPYPKNLTKEGHFNCPLVTQENAVHYADMGTRFCDPGNMAVHVPLVRRYGLKFRLYDVMTRRTGGEDTTFAMQCVSKGFYRVWSPSALVWHLEKPASRTCLTEHAYRKEMLLRVGEEQGLFNERLTHAVFEQELLPWEPLDIAD